MGAVIAEAWKPRMFYADKPQRLTAAFGSEQPYSQPKRGPSTNKSDSLVAACAD
jgi:hypothetical protein